jgi:septation ring formation regulator EzrA
LDDLKEDQDDLQAEFRAIAALYRKLDPVPSLLEQYMKTTDARLDRMHTDIRDLRQENRVAHQKVDKKTDTIVKQTSGTNWKEFFTYLVGAAAGVGVPVALALVLH